MENKYKKFLEEEYNMASKITLADFLKCYKNVIGVYAIDEETNENFFGAFDKSDINNLTAKEKNYKVVSIYPHNIIIYIGK